ncbi:glucose-6-phosphate isomerase [Nitrosomonas sp.]|uniref:glucose-6-phosphate isomerase n=1 Tax=Nitrosomonas sp. TaxID=42353 RepID=UPI0025EFBF8F|nr:glucose-6-phosphate isomerase [Nitrosomonas sp.]MCC6917104.1 glucose-6-phosphate isomerase [Nitrosomonas sp.]
MSTLTQSPAWLALDMHQAEMASRSLRTLFSEDPQRFSKFSLQFGDLLLDYSKQPVDETTIQLLLALAEQQKLADWLARMANGEKINFTENRSALHIALRANSPVFTDGVDVTQEVRRVLQQIEHFTEKIHGGMHRGYTGLPITDVVNIGIGGSDLGPVMVTEALRPCHVPQLRVHFVSNIDGAHLSGTLQQLNPATTLFIIASKTFTTQETLTNAHSARKWFLANGGSEQAIAAHFVAVSTNREAVSQFGINPDNMFEFWDWVGGRYSLWSAIGLPIALAVGMENFRSLLAGAQAMDHHFLTAPFEQNLPVMLGLIGIWQINFFHITSQAILPYDQSLHRLPAYLQQLEMESNGKRVNRNGETVDYSTGAVIWGESGTNGQHAFYQLLHQGTQKFTADFLAPCQCQHPLTEHHPMLLANFFAQTEALMRGKTAQEVRTELLNQHLPASEVERLLPHRVFPGNHATTSILFKKLDPATLGKLIALYEHKVFVQGIIWEINSFDQWGVELGKQLAGTILSELISDYPRAQHDASTRGLIDFYRAQQ